ncbi:dynein light chain Tctex-type protein 2B isoform X2 [Boleophthalmus pectinirostris]|uniref:dynein light chain Tctex-type protein 2B isoform X2 n=1 Tax=Boleophthalmus pectinirostris TaxID=150288 RepID=UPI00242A646E|nr:dynein light chain Tctex-type protein 2B isoform X2 [Boleophthalmus pectinirostris]
MGTTDTYLIRPNHQNKFKPAVVKECIREVVRERLTGVRYDAEEVQKLSNTLADSIKDRVKKAGFDRYKLAVQVVIGEQRGQGVKKICFVWRWCSGAITIDDCVEDVS